MLKASAAPPLTTRLRMLRAEHRISQMAAARSMGVSHSTYWSVENGYREATDDEKAVLAALFGVPVSDIWSQVA